MTTNLTLQLTIQATDQASQAVRATAQAVTQANQQVSTSTGQMRKAFFEAGLALKVVEKGFEALVGVTRSVIRELNTSIGVFSQLETKLAKVATLNEQVARSQGQFLTQLAALAPRVFQNAGNLAEGFFEIIDGGVTDARAAMRILEAAARTATAGFEDLNGVAKAGSTVMNAFNVPLEQAGQLFDQLKVTADVGRGSVSEFGTALGQVGGVAQAAGLRMEDVSAALAVMTLNGQSASGAASGLRVIMDALLTPSKGLADALKQMGVDSGATLLQTRGLQGSLETLATALNTGKLSIQDLGVDGRQLNNLFTLISREGAAQFQQALTEITNATGRVDEQFAIATNTLEGARTKLAETINQFRTALGAELAPALKELFGAITEIVEALIGEGPGGLAGGLRRTIESLTSFIRENKDEIVAFATNLGTAIAAITTTIGTLAQGVIGFFNNIISSPALAQTESRLGSLLGRIAALPKQQQLAELELERQRIGTGAAALAGNLREALVTFGQAELERAISPDVLRSLGLDITNLTLPEARSGLPGLSTGLNRQGELVVSSPVLELANAFEGFELTAHQLVTIAQAIQALQAAVDRGDVEQLSQTLLDVGNILGATLRPGVQVGPFTVPTEPQPEPAPGGPGSRGRALIVTGQTREFIEQAAGFSANIASLDARIATLTEEITRATTSQGAALTAGPGIALTTELSALLSGTPGGGRGAGGDGGGDTPGMLDLLGVGQPPAVQEALRRARRRTRGSAGVDRRIPFPAVGPEFADIQAQQVAERELEDIRAFLIRQILRVAEQQEARFDFDFGLTAELLQQFGADELQRILDETRGFVLEGIEQAIATPEQRAERRRETGGAGVSRQELPFLSESAAQAAARETLDQMRATNQDTQTSLGAIDQERIQQLTFLSLLASTTAEFSQMWVDAVTQQRVSLAQAIAELSQGTDLFQRQIEQANIRAMDARDAVLDSLIPPLPGEQIAGGPGTTRQRLRRRAMPPAIFHSGGFTGPGSPDQPAGIVHAGEFVVPADKVPQNLGVLSLLQQGIISQLLPGFQQGSLVEPQQFSPGGGSGPPDLSRFPAVPPGLVPRAPHNNALYRATPWTFWMDNLVEGGFLTWRRANPIWPTLEALFWHAYQHRPFYPSGVVDDAIRLPGGVSVPRGREIQYFNPDLFRVVFGDALAGRLFGEEFLQLPRLPFPIKPIPRGEGPIPLAQGGLVTKPTLSILGEAGPELVVPLPGFQGGGAVPARQGVGAVGESLAAQLAAATEALDTLRRVQAEQLPILAQTITDQEQFVAVLATMSQELTAAEQRVSAAQQAIDTLNDSLGANIAATERQGLSLVVLHRETEATTRTLTDLADADRKRREEEERRRIETERTIPTLQAFNDGLAQLNRFLQTSFEAIKLEDAIQAQGEALKDLISNLGQTALNLLGTFFADPVEALLFGLLGSSKPLVDALGGAFKALMDAINPIVQLIGVLLAPAFQVLAAILQPIATVIRGIGDIVTKVLDFFTFGIFKFNQQYNAALNPQQPTQTPGGGGASPTFTGVPGLPTKFQQGGIIARPTLAFLGEAGPEAVIPLGQGRPVFPRGGFGLGQVTTNISVIVQGNVDSPATADRLAAQIGRNLMYRMPQGRFA